MVTQPYKKKLIEVAIPLEAINAASAREKSIRHGHPSTLHLWWARRPLAACRAVLFAQLVDDPSSHPDKFRTEEAVETERKRLFKIIEELVKWENSTNEEVLERARAEIRKSCGDELPPVYDPFSGGGSIPLEAQRLGLPAYGSDLNPVAVMIGKAMIEIPPKFKDLEPVHPGPKERTHYRNAEGLAEDVKYYGEWMREKAWDRIGHLYPEVDLPTEFGGGKATVIAWIWARTVPSPDPAFSDVQIPLVRSFDISTKKGKEAWVEPVVAGNSYHFEIKTKAAGDKRHDLVGTVKRSGGECILSKAAIPFKYIRQKAKAGEMGQRLMAVVAQTSNGRVFLSPTDEIERVAFSANPSIRPSATISHWPGRTNVVEYGLTTFGDLFTDRQLTALGTISELVHDARKKIQKDARVAGLPSQDTPLRDSGKGARAYSEAVSVYLSFILDKCSDYQSSICSWIPQLGAVRNTFARHAIPMVWDFVEVNPFSGKVGSFGSMSTWVEKVLQNFVPANEGSIIQQDAQSLSMREGAVVSTDPPYYDNISYADLSDYFYCWLRPSLKEVFPELFSVITTPKSDELVATPYRDNRGKSVAEEFFLSGMKSAISRMVSESSSLYPSTIYYAFKQSEIDQEGISSTGWATFLQAVLEAGFSVVGTWPVRTEFSNRPVASGSNALANSVVLVCRKKEDTAATITRAEFIRALKRELPQAIVELQAANIAPADMPQSAIGPGMGVFSRYKAVLEADDSSMSVKTALKLINAELDEYLGGIQGEFDTDTRFAITWFEQFGMTKGAHGIADNLARARGISVNSVKHAGIVESTGGNVRLLKRDELDPDWEPATDTHLTVWECLQHLIRIHQANGVAYPTALMLKKIGGRAEATKDLAYCLYDLSANKRQDAKEAVAYNALIADWTDLSREAAAVVEDAGNGQIGMDI